MNTFKSLLLFLFLCIPVIGNAQELKILSWNIQDLGKTKNDAELQFIAKVMMDYDIIAVQEVVAVDPAGAKAVAKIAELLNRMGSRWDYRVSDPTDSEGKRKERYAYIWKSSVVKLQGRPWLDSNLARAICREPFMARFSANEFTFLLANYHSIPHSSKPQKENMLLVYHLPILYPDDHLIIAGDFNIGSEKDFWNESFRSEKLDLQPFNTKSTLRKACTTNNDFTYTNHAIDFFIFEKDEINVIESGVLDYIGECGKLEVLRKISDHLPAWVVIMIKD